MRPGAAPYAGSVSSVSYTHLYVYKRQSMGWKMPALIWAAIVIFCFIPRNDISIAEILSFEPKNKLTAAFILIAMFGIKSLSIVIYNGILYVAAGIMFPLPIAVLVNIIGTAVMVSLPYVIGRFIGTSAVERIVSKYPKAQQVKELRAEKMCIRDRFI